MLRPACPSPREALPLLGEVPSAHTGERGLRGRTWCRPEKTERSVDNSFPHWLSLRPGTLSVSLSLDSSPEGGAKGVERTHSPREALPLLGEVPSAHTGERGLRGRTRCRPEKTGRCADNSFPYWQSLSHGDPSVSLTLDSSPEGGAKGVNEAAALIIIISDMHNVKFAATCLPNHRHSEEGEARRGSPFSLRRTKTLHSPKGMRIATSLRSSQ